MIKQAKQNVTARLLDRLNHSSEPPTSPEPAVLPEPLAPPKPPMSPEPTTLLELPPVGCPVLTLPTELFYRITTFIFGNSTVSNEQNTSYLSQLVLVNKRFNQVYTPLLYENVSLKSYDQLLRYHCNPGAMNNSRFATSLSIACSALLKHSTPPHGTTWPEILSPLFEMKNLRKLVIPRSGGMCSYSNIEHPALEYLTSQAANPAFLPNLSTLEIPHHPRLFALCTGRPVTIVSLGPNVAPVLNVEFEDYSSGFTKGTRPLEELSLYWPANNETGQLFASKISQVVKLCPQLRILDMRLPRGFMEFINWNGDNFESLFVPWVQTTLAPLSQLTRLSLHISQPRGIPIDTQESTVQALARIMPKLVHIVLPVAQCEWSRTPGCDEFTGWSPRPNFGSSSLNWWLDFLGLDGTAHVWYAAYIDHAGHIRYPHKGSEQLGKLGHTAFCEDVARVISSMRERWDEECIPLPSEIEELLLGRARRAESFGWHDSYDFLDTPL